ncbi:helix-turn-helix domain-containing protein [bacterium]|nr:helix-turn-helix domain-containing protein [bacterium]
MAAKLGESRQNVSNWRCGKHMPDLQKIKKLAEIFKIEVDSLIGDTPVRVERMEPDPERAEVIRRRGQRLWVDQGGGETHFSIVPILGAVEAGPMASPAEDVRLDHESLPDSWVGRWAELEIDCIPVAERMLHRKVKNSTVAALRVSGRSMMPRYQDGDVILVERIEAPDGWLKNGDHVIVDIGGGRYVLKAWWPVVQVLGSINTDEFIPIPFNEQMRFFGVVIGLIRESP